MDHRDLIERARIVRLLERKIDAQRKIARGPHYTSARDATAAIAALQDAIACIESGEQHAVAA